MPSKMVLDLGRCSLHRLSYVVFHGVSPTNRDVDVLFNLNDINPRHFGELSMLLRPHALRGIMPLPAILASYNEELAVIWHDYHVRLKGR